MISSRGPHAGKKKKGGGAGERIEIWIHNRPGAGPGLTLIFSSGLAELALAWVAARDFR